MFKKCPVYWLDLQNFMNIIKYFPDSILHTTKYMNYNAVSSILSTDYIK